MTVAKKQKLVNLALFVLIIIIISPSFSLVTQFLAFSNISVTKGTEDWEDAGLYWYYENLTDEDRKKIRQAIDYCINRQHIIDVLMKGYAVPIPTEVGQNIIGYDPSIHPREYNLSKAKELMTEVFNKTYDPELYISDPQHYTNESYFHMTLVSSTTSPIQSESATLIAEALKQIGIDTNLKFWPFNVIIPRLFSDPVTDPRGANYEHGGFDAYFFDYRTSIDPDYSGEYYPEFFAPIGDNTMYIERPDIVEIINRSLQEVEYENRIDALQDFQEWSYEWVPKSIISQNQKLFVQNSNISGLDLYNYGRTPWVHNITITGRILPYTLNMCIPTNIIDFNPLLSHSWYDSVFSSNIHLSLAQRRGYYNLSHAIPALAKSWTASADGLIWTVALREGVKFHDGSEVTADDVVFSYNAAMECPTSSWRDDMVTWFNKASDIKKINEYTIEFNLKQKYPYVTTKVFSLPILSKAQMESIAFEDWKTNGTNKGTIQLLGCGPYVFVEAQYIPETRMIYKSVISDHWNATLMGHDPDAVGGGIWWDVTNAPQNFTVKVIDSAVYAVNQIQTRSIDLIEPSTGIYDQIVDLETDPNIKIDTKLEYGWTGLFFNHYDPRWGLNPHDPYDMYRWARPPANYVTDPEFVLGYVLFFLFGYFILLILFIKLGVQKILKKHNSGLNSE